MMNRCLFHSGLDRTLTWRSRDPGPDYEAIDCIAYDHLYSQHFPSSTLTNHAMPIAMQPLDVRGLQLKEPRLVQHPFWYLSLL
jgi:hypothetical protein